MTDIDVPTFVFVSGVYVSLRYIVACEWHLAADASGSRQPFFYVTLAAGKGYKLPAAAGKRLEALLQKYSTNLDKGENR